MNFTYDYNDGKEEILVHTDEQYLDRSVLKIIQDRTDLFLPVSIREEKSGYVFIYDMRGAVNLKAWMSEAAQQEQDRMRTEIMNGQREIFGMGICEENLLTKDRYMYVDMETQHIRFICTAVRAEVSETEIQTREESEDKSWEIYEEGLPELPPVPPVPTMDQPEAEDEAPEVEPLPEVDMAEEEEISYNESSSKNQIHEVFTENNMSETDNMTGWRKYEDNKDDDATRGFGFGFGSDGKEDGETEEETILLIQPPQIIGKLIRCATGEEFILDEGMNIVGKSKIRADICIRNNPAIGNVHCEISREDNEFYLEDNRSLNGTYLENTKLDPEVRTLLETEDRIRLADEEFIFRTEQGEEKIL